MTQKILCTILLTIVFSTGYLTVEAQTFSVNTATALINAINIANTNNEDDVITLTDDITLTSALPDILPDAGNSLTIRGNGFTIDRDVTSANFRIFFINAGANLALLDVTVQNGIADDGGGIFNAGILNLTNSTISNSAALNGGGVYNSGTLAITNSTISNNTASANFGGGIYNSGTLNITTSTVSNNTAPAGGGIFNFAPGTMTVSNVTIFNNIAEFGGGIFNGAGILTVLNSTISTNIANRRGGGTYNDEGTLTLNNSTISSNVAVTESGGGIYEDVTSTLIISNTIIVGNTAPVDSECTISSGAINADANNLFGIDGTGGGCQVGASDLSPNTALLNILEPLADNGGPTQTHAIVAGSPALDASGIGAIILDQRGASSIGTRDIGAFEFDGIVPSVTIAPVSNTAILEDGGTATITVTVSDLGISSLTIRVNIVDVTAIEGIDYNITNMLTFNTDGSQDITITGLPDALIEGNESLTVNFSLTGRADISGDGNQTITLVEPIAPIFNKAFVPDIIDAENISTLTLTIDNTGSLLDATALAFTDNLPASMVVATPPNASTTCTGGTLTANAGANTVSYTGGTLSAGSNCSVQVNVTSAVSGIYLNISQDLTSTLGISGTVSATLTVTDLTAPPTNPDVPSLPDTIVSGEPNISVFDPAISKIGFLTQGQVGVTGEQLEWIVTVSNTGNAVGNNVIVTDTLIDALQVDQVEAPNGMVTINGQIVSVRYANLNVGETVQFSIFTTVLDGAEINNVACVIADNQVTETCVRATAVSQLPRTGESPFWRNNILSLLGVSIFTFVSLLILRGRMVQPHSK